LTQTSRLNTPEAKEKRKQTLIQRYGTTDVFKLHRNKAVIRSAEQREVKYRNTSFSELSIRQKKRRLIEQRGHRCESCQNVSWLGNPITLELDHIDGNKQINTESNLRLLCPNCHSITPTWRKKKSAVNSLARE
jgi:Zn finger protein HypA/HybF involved in hydrogenase expression